MKKEFKNHKPELDKQVGKHNLLTSGSPSGELKITKKKNSLGQIMFYIKHNKIRGVVGESFDNLYSAKKRLKELRRLINETKI